MIFNEEIIFPLLFYSLLNSGKVICLSFHVKGLFLYCYKHVYAIGFFFLTKSDCCKVFKFCTLFQTKKCHKKLPSQKIDKIVTSVRSNCRLKTSGRTSLQIFNLFLSPPEFPHTLFVVLLSQMAFQ